jgi:hypothetical protein
MQTFLTADPITIEIRNASGEIRVDLADVVTTTVDVVAATSHPLGFLDDVIRAAKAQFAGSRSGFDSGSAGFDNDAAPVDPTDRVRIEFRQPAPRSSVIDASGADAAGADAAGADVGLAGAGRLIVDTDPARDGWKSSFSVHVTAPTASGIRIQSQSADITLTGRSERLEARTASGDVRVEEVTDRSVVQTASGAVWIAATGHCDVRTASGDIQVNGISVAAVVHSTSGDIKLDNTTGNINARSVSGDIQLMDATSGSVELVTVSGDVQVGIHAGSLTAVDLSTISGKTDTDYQVSATVPRDEAPMGEAPVADAPIGEVRVDGTSGGEAAADGVNDTIDEPVLDLRVKTTSGNIRLRRAVAAAR